MKREERVWILAWATLMGFSLLMLHNWVETLSKPGEYFDFIWPLYVFAISAPLSMQMLSRYRSEKLLWLMAASFSVIMAGAASYVGHYAWIENLPSNGPIPVGEMLVMTMVVSSCWFILMPFAEHRLVRDSWWNEYALLFSGAWRNTVKLISATAFVGLFWGLLFLWAGLFKVLKIDFFYELFTGRNFVYPVTAIAYGMGISLYSTKEEALVNLYRTSLNILGWLLPLVTFIMLLFLFALPFQGLAALWKTGHATTLMLTLQGLIVFLFNAAWQDADGTIKFPKWLRNLISVGLVAMPVYSVLCAYSLGLRISEHGWSVERIWAALAVLVMSIYAIGYATTSIRRQTVWMVGAKFVNIATALIVVALLMLTATPVLDPARISVNSQVGRLLANSTSVADFDFDYLRFRTGKFGNDELRNLLKNTSHPQAELLHQRAEEALKKKYAYESQANGVGISRERLAAYLTLYPKGTVLDPSFVDYLAGQLNEHKFSLPCIQNGRSCQLLAIDLKGEGSIELVLFDAFQSKVFEQRQSKWELIGNLTGQKVDQLTGPSLKHSLDVQDIELRPHKWRDIRVGPDYFSVNEIAKSEK